MKKKNIFACILIVLGFSAFLLWIVSVVFNIGKDLSDINIYLEYIYYVLAIFVMYVLLVRPFMIVMFAPSFSLEKVSKSLTGKQKKSVIADNYKKLRKLAHRLIKRNLVNENNINLLTAELRKKDGDLVNKYTSLKKLVDECINKDLKKDIRKIVINASKDTLYLTSISQNSFVDILVVVVNNFRLLKKIVVRCGYRPSFIRLMKFYINVSFSALIADGAQKMDVNALFGNTLKGLAKPVVGSLLDGSVNAFFMLRTGFIARNYILEECNDEDSINESRRIAIFDASVALPELAVETVVAPVAEAVMNNVVNPTKKAVKDLFSKKEKLTLDESK